MWYSPSVFIKQYIPCVCWDVVNKFTRRNTNEWYYPYDCAAVIWIIAMLQLQLEIYRSSWQDKRSTAITMWLFLDPDSTQWMFNPLTAGAAYIRVFFLLAN